MTAMKKYFYIFCLVIFSACTAENITTQIPITQDPPTISIETEVSDNELTPTNDEFSPLPPTILPPLKPSIILYIGDGMGSDHRIAGQFYSVGEVRQLNMDMLPVSGWLITDSYGAQLTESAAAATALATGHQTYNDIISLDIHGKPLKTILEYAQDTGMSTGIVSNKFITDATTAAFGSHVESNSMGAEVASQFIENRVNVIFGGGENDFLPRGVEGCHPEYGKRLDERNLIDEAIDIGYIFICDEESLHKVSPQTDSHILGLFADENIVPPNFPSLEDMTKKAIDILSLNPNGFFLVVEGGMIDIASHFQESENVLNNVIGLDQAVKAGIEFADKNKDNTLIIVTADHETGGLRVDINSNGLKSEDGPFRMPNGTEFFLTWATGGHTGANVPVSAYGQGTDRLIGLNENTIVFDIMLEFLGIQARVD